MVSLTLIIHNVRSTHNVGSMLRTAEGLGVDSVYLTGYTPYPKQTNDNRLPHVAAKLDSQIHKTALGAEHSVKWHHSSDVASVITKLQTDGWQVVALEQTPRSASLTEMKMEPKIALLVGREVEGIETEVLDLCNAVAEIPMHGKKESFNVSVTAAMALYHCRFMLL